MYTVVAFTESQDSASLVNVAAVADTLYRTNGDDLFVPRELANLAGWWFGGANFTAGQIVSPSIRRRWPIDVDEADLAAEPGSPVNFTDRFDSPIPLVPTEQINVLAAEDAAGASRVTAVLFLSDGETTPVSGDIATIRATGTTTLVANAWTVGQISFSQTLPAGRYALVGARVQSAGLIAARFVPVSGGHRAGVLGCDADSDIGLARFRYGRCGTLLEFDHDAPPQVEYLSASADTAEVLSLDLIEIGGVS